MLKLFYNFILSNVLKLADSGIKNFPQFKKIIYLRLKFFLPIPKDYVPFKYKMLILLKPLLTQIHS